MPKNNETTTKFKVDISELKAGIQEANRQIRLANAEFKAASSGMDNWADSTDGVSAKIKQLETVLQSENAKLENLKKQLALVEKEQGENSKGADELRIAIANQQATVNKTEKSLKGYRSKLDDLENGLDDAEKASDDANDSTKDLGDGFTVLKGTMANLIADGIKNFIGSIANLAGETREYRNEMSKLETAFANHGAGVNGAKKTYEEFYGVLGDEGQATEAVNFLAKLTDNEKDLATWTDICTGVYGEFGASLPIEGLTEAANETAKVGAVTGPLADALNWAGQSEDEFNEKLEKCSSEQERQQLIMNTLNGIYGESANKFRETNKEVIEANKAQGKLNDTTAKLGEIAEPVITSVKSGFADLLAKIVEMVSGGDIEKFTDKIDEGFSWISKNVLPPIKDAIQWVIDNKDAVIAGIAGIGAAMLTMNVANMIMGVVKAFKAFKAAQEGATVAQWLLNVAMNANPIGLLVAAIVGLVAAFAVLWNKSEAFRNFFIGMWEGIKKAVKAVVDWIKENWKTMLLFLVNPMAGIFKYCYEHFEGFRNFVDKIIKNVKKFFSDLWKGIKDGAKKAIDGVKNVWKNVSNWFNDNLIKPVKNFFVDLWNKLEDGAKSAWNGVKKVFSKVGEFFGGIWNTIKEKFSALGTKIGDAISGSVKAGINGVLTIIERTINGFFRLINGAIGLINKIPGVEISKIKEVSFPRMYRGGVLKKGQVGLLEGSGAEAVVPLENNAGWIRKTAADLKMQLQNEGVLGGAGKSVVNNYNFTQNNMSPKSLSRLEIYRQTKNQLALAKGV